MGACCHGSGPASGLNTFAIGPVILPRMDHVITVQVALLAFVQSASVAQAPSTPPAGWTSDSVAIAQASRAWMRALQDGDRPALESLLTPEFALDTPGREGPPLPKEEWITNALTILETDSAGYEVLHVRRLGPDLAVSNGRLYWKARLKGVPIPRLYDVTDVWVRSEGRWQVAGRDADFAGGSVAKIAFAGGIGVTAFAWALTALVRRWRRRRATTPSASGRANPSP